ncbi:hypothetical protein DPMN_031339 [Dreissena polymorpha]|uniref:Uncharacterized protein n=1 Tax=Dreissena polymorpha TaxID=45954 RepID=A0A9D4RH88_DREPO|nr:hypothetical protein DPMN_031339 [Dreissena polymorpha]
MLDVLPERDSEEWRRSGMPSSEEMKVLYGPSTCDMLREEAACRLATMVLSQGPFSDISTAMFLRAM